jgi:hypothetical protein
VCSLGARRILATLLIATTSVFANVSLAIGALICVLLRAKSGTRTGVPVVSSATLHLVSEFLAASLPSLLSLRKAVLCRRSSPPDPVLSAPPTTHRECMLKSLRDLARQALARLSVSWVVPEALLCRSSHIELSRSLSFHSFSPKASMI